MTDALSLTPKHCTTVVVSYNSANVLRDCLQSTQAQGVQMIVIDNASSDASCEIAQECSARIIKNNKNQGFGRAANRALSEVSTPYALLINPDAVLEEDALQTLLDAASAMPEAGLLAPRIMEPDGRFFWQQQNMLAKSPLHNPGGTKMRPEGLCCAPFLSGAVLLIKMAHWRAIGGFDDNIFLFYEDDDLCRRMMDAGCALVHVHDAVALHLRGQSSPPTPERAFKTRWHSAWSACFMAQKHGLPSPAQGIIRRNVPKVLWAWMMRDKSRTMRYWGSVSGARAFLRGQTALQQEDLE